MLERILVTTTTFRCDWCGTEAQEEAGAAYPPGQHPLEGWVIRQGPLTTTGIAGVPPMPMRHFCSREHEARFLLTQGADVLRPPGETGS